MTFKNIAKMKQECNIPTDLTFEDFERLADRKPNLEGDFIYKLTQLFIDPDKLKNPYPKFKIDYEQNRLFKSFEDAKNYLENNKSEEIYCSWITQIPTGVNKYERTAEWFYDHEGTLLDYSAQKSHGDHEDMEFCFFGRPSYRQRFKEGDIVEVVSGDEICLAVLCGNVPDVEWCWKYYQSVVNNKKFSYYGLDYTDESTCVIDGPSYCFHSHPSPLCLMKPRFPIPPELEADMKTWKERADKETGEDMENYPSRRVRTKTVNCSEYVCSANYDLSLYFKFDKDGNLLLLLDDSYGLRVSLRTDRPEYADFEDFTCRLTASQLNALQDYLEDVEIGKTKWWYILREWNQDDDNAPIPLDTPLPDYTKLIRD